MNKRIFLIVLTLLVTSCTGSGEPSSSTIPSSSEPISSSTAPSSSKPVTKNGINIQTMLQQLYINDSQFMKCMDYAAGTDELSRPNSLTIDLRGGDEYVISMYEIDENNNKVLVREVKTTGSTYDYTNFKINTTYRYMTQVYKEGKAIRSFTSKPFTTTGYLRNVYISGVTNARDLGGYTTEEGRLVKQGLVFRSGGWEEGAYDKITAEGIKTVQEDLKIKSEVDLRDIDNGETGGRTESPVPGVKYVGFQMYDFETMDKKALTAIKNMFEFMTHEENYPMDFHCAIGTDRTGLMAMLIHGILGASEERIFRDYLFSNFGNIGGTRDGTIMNNYFKFITEGNTIQEKVTNYLVNKVGVPASQIEAIRNILLK